MANKLNQIVDVNISISNRTVTREGFGIPLFLGESMKLSQRVKSYSSIEEVATDFDITDPEYKQALVSLSQTQALPTIFIGKKVLLNPTVIVEATNPTDVIVNINAVGIGKQAEVGAYIVIAGFNEPEYNGTFMINTIVDDDNILYSAATTPSATPATGSGTYALNETWQNAVIKCQEANSGWYAIAISSNVKDDILSVASEVEVLKKLFIARSSDINNLNEADTSSVLYQLHALSYDRTALIYNADTVNYFADAAWLGVELSTIPGSSNWAFKTLTGIIADNLTQAQSNAIFENKGNTYETFAGVSITRQGFVVSGQYIDIIRGIDWLTARLQEEVFRLLVNTPKIPYTNAGALAIYNTINTVLSEATANNLIATKPDGTGDYEIILTLIEDLPEADNLGRILSGIGLGATLSGAINKARINGSLSA